MIHTIKSLKLDIITTEYLEIMKEKYPDLYIKLTHHPTKNKNFNDFLKHSEEWQKMVAEKKKIMGSPLKPGNKFNFQTWGQRKMSCVTS